MVNLLHDKDASLDTIKDKTIAIIGYGAQGRAQANCLKESGMNVLALNSRKVSADKFEALPGGQ